MAENSTDITLGSIELTKNAVQLRSKKYWSLPWNC